MDGSHDYDVGSDHRRIRRCLGRAEIESEARSLLRDLRRREYDHLFFSEALTRLRTRGGQRESIEQTRNTTIRTAGGKSYNIFISSAVGARVPSQVRRGSLLRISRGFRAGNFALADLRPSVARCAHHPRQRGHVVPSDHPHTDEVRLRLRASIAIPTLIAHFEWQAGRTRLRRWLVFVRQQRLFRPRGEVVDRFAGLFRLLGPFFLGFLGYFS